MKNVFLGDYVEVLSVMHEEIKTHLVIIEEKNKKGKVYSFCIENGIEFLYVKNKKDFISLEKDIWGVVFIASFGLILDDIMLDRCKMVFNFHPGNVYNCRGRHPLPSAIKRKDDYMAISVHIVNDASIDRGDLFAQYFISIEYSKSYEWNYMRLKRGLAFLASELCFSIKSNNIPLWNWEPEKNSYQEMLLEEELHLIANAKKLGDIEL